MYPLMNIFSNDPYYTAANLIEQVNLQPWTDYQLGVQIPRRTEYSPTANLVLEYTKGKIGLVPAKPVSDLNGINIRGTKAKLVKVDVSGYPQNSKLTAGEINNRLRAGKPVALQTLLQERWGEMRSNDQRVAEFLSQGMLEGKIQAVDEDGTPYILNDLTAAAPNGFGVGPQTMRVDWTAGADAKDFPDAIAQAKSMSRKAMGGSAGPVTQYGLFSVGPAAEGIRTNASVRKAKYLADTSWAGSDRIVKVDTIAENVRMISYEGYDLGGYTALDLDTRGEDDFGCAYLVPLTADIFRDVFVPPELLSTINQPALPSYSWLLPNTEGHPDQLVNLSYWSGKISYCTVPDAIIKIKRPA